VPCYNTTNFFIENAAINIPKLDLMVCCEGTDSYGQFVLTSKKKFGKFPVKISVFPFWIRVKDQIFMTYTYL
jgi:hypothetical protein